MQAKDIALGLTLPMWQRVLRGEGGLVLVAALLTLDQDLPMGRRFLMTGLAGAMLANTYLYNDIMDSSRDALNPKKNETLRLILFRDRPQWTGIAHGIALVILVVCGWFGGADSAVAASIVWTVNAAYSHLFKGVPYVDIAAVGLWGGAVAGIVEPAMGRVVLVGAMTAVSHIFQTLDDQAPDTAAAVRTTVVFRPHLATSILTIWCALVAGAAAWQVEDREVQLVVAALAFAPVALRSLIPSCAQAWMFSRWAYAICLGIVLQPLEFINA